MDTVVVTGVSGNLGTRLLRQLADYKVIGVDFVEPSPAAVLARFERVDLGREESCHELVTLIQKSGAVAVVHLAFILDAVRTGVTDPRRMWQINVAGTARIMEAITEAQRRGALVRKFLFPSSVSAYGPDLPHAVTEDAPLRAHTLPYAVHKRECDEVVRARARSIEPCRTYLLRPHIFVGATMQNYLVGALRGTPTGQGKLAERLRAKGKRLPMLLPSGARYRQHRYQFVHVDDMARLLTHILGRPDNGPTLTVLNVASRGIPISIQRCAEIAGTQIRTVPTRALCRLVLKLMWDLGISAFPPEAFPYMAGQYTMDTTRLQRFLGSAYEQVMQYTLEEALADSFRSSQPPEPALQHSSTAG